MKSDRLAYGALKYGLLLFGLLFILIPTLNLIDPELATFNSEHKEMDWFSFIIFILIGLIAILAFMLFQDKFAIVEMGNQKIKVNRGSEEIEVNWLEVESIDLLQFIFPPLYKLRIKGHEGYILFATSRSGLSVAGFTKDLSEMGGLINKKKREFGI
jgi:hypothetical protein